jgi:hypothetical protein
LYESGRGFILDGNPLTDFIHGHLGWIVFATALSSPGDIGIGSQQPSSLARRLA